MRTHDAGLGRGRRVSSAKIRFDHQANDFTRREVLAGGFVGVFGELADQLLERQAHLHVVHFRRMQVDRGELLAHQVQQLGLVQPLDRDREVEVLEDRTHIGCEALEVAVQIGTDVVLVAHEPAHVQRRDVVEIQARLALDERLEVDARPPLVVVLGERGFLGGGQHAVETAQHGERRITRPYSLCLKSPRRRSATDQMRVERAC